MTETKKSLPEIYREAADLVMEHGKYEGGYGSKDCGFCTMGAVIFAAGHIYKGKYPEIEIHSDEFWRLIKPVEDQIVSTGRRSAVVPDDNETENDALFQTVYYWNDRHENEPTAEDVAALLRETADAVENEEVSA